MQGPAWDVLLLWLRQCCEESAQHCDSPDNNLYDWCQGHCQTPGWCCTYVFHGAEMVLAYIAAHYELAAPPTGSSATQIWMYKDAFQWHPLTLQGLLAGTRAHWGPQIPAPTLESR